MSTNISSETKTTLYAPRLSLCQCVRAYITRSTLDAATLTETQRQNHFPAAPLCVITWYFQGQAMLLQIGDVAVKQDIPTPITFNGPRTQAVVTYNPEPIEIFMLVLLPEAVNCLTGIDVSTYTDRSTAFDQVFNTEWQNMAKSVLAVTDTAQRIDLIERFLQEEWTNRQADKGQQAHMLRDYLQGMAMQLLASKWTRSIRQIERRVKTWSGLTFQRLHGLRRAEQRYVAARDMLYNDNASWSDVAIETGYSDQAHFCRETRKITGLTPAQLKKCIVNEESYWIYRIWS